MGAFVVSRYGWVRDIPDPRDKIFTAPDNRVLPSFVDLRPGMPPVWNQGKLGSCTAFSVCAAVEYQARVEGQDTGEPSQLFVYYNERKDEGTTSYDSGASIRESIKAVNTYGVCPERLWPYDVEKYMDAPPKSTYPAALLQEALTYESVVVGWLPPCAACGATNPDTTRQVTTLRAALAANHPICIGITVFSSFESSEAATTGHISMPDPLTEQLMGGHALCLVGYDDPAQLFTFRNSWGEVWGDNGYGYLPYRYLADPNLASDFWCITSTGA